MPDQPLPDSAPPADSLAPGVMLHDDAVAVIDDGTYGDPTLTRPKPDFIQQEERGWHRLVSLRASSTD
jgi:hypothetical protein